MPLPGPLADAAQGIEVLEGLLTGPERIELAPWRLRVEDGRFIGTVLVRNLPAARWLLLPNGHPVVHLAVDTDLDVIALARARLGRARVGSKPNLRATEPGRNVRRRQAARVPTSPSR